MNRTRNDRRCANMIGFIFEIIGMTSEIKRIAPDIIGIVVEILGEKGV